ncbi:MAG: sigma-70 family RNA polymerase sigma factor, partial [Gemmatimonadetes bacterium]|nr:sigma-70 family RNA polymerase sigma factor [Gemmatimonadota bacterium]
MQPVPRAHPPLPRRDPRGHHDARRPRLARGPRRPGRERPGAGGAARHRRADPPLPGGDRVTATTPEVLWQRFRATGDPEARAEILTQLLGLVHFTARKIANRVGDAVPYDDLVGAGSLGLVQAIGGFDPDRGVSFVTYATQRVHGAILDELRAADWRPRSVRERARRIDRATRTLHGVLDRPPTPDEVAASLEIDRDTYWQWRSDAEAGVTVP